MRGSCAEESSENRYSAVNWAMLRFRPIAPKPASGDAVPCAADRGGAIRNGKRKKRKYVRFRDRQSTETKITREAGRPSPTEKSGFEDGSSPERGVVTLQLMPENDKSCDNNSTAEEIQGKNWNLVNEETSDKVLDGGGIVGGVTAAAGSIRSVIKTWITVECVTDAFTDSGVGLGFSDWEKINNLRADMCPGFVSDGTNNVVWVNDAYRKLVAEGEAAENIEITVWLAVKEELPNFSPSFGCRVRMSQQTRDGQIWNRTLACDVWRMESAGFAWKLDVTTALGLGI